MPINSHNRCWDQTVNSIPRLELWTLSPYHGPGFTYFTHSPKFAHKHLSLGWFRICFHEESTFSQEAAKSTFLNCILAVSACASPLGLPGMELVGFSCTEMGSKLHAAAPREREEEVYHPCLSALTPHLVKASLMDLVGAYSLKKAARCHTGQATAGWGMQLAMSPFGCAHFYHVSLTEQLPALYFGTSHTYLNNFNLLSRAFPKAGIRWWVRFIAVGISCLKIVDTFLPWTDFPCFSSATSVKPPSRAKERRENLT